MEGIEPTIFHLIGSPGVGKYTVAREICGLTGARLVDNHAIANVIFNLLDQDGVKPLPEGVWTPVGQVRRAVLDTLAAISPRHLSFVFTNYIRGEDDAERAAFEEMVAVADARGSRFVPVLLSCDTPELLRRVVNDSRRERMKLVDPVVAKRINDEVPHFETNHPNTLRLDVTDIPATEAATTIVAWARGRPFPG
jgi:hypothetical protein